MSEITTQEIIEIILEEGMDYRDFKCEYAAKNANDAQACGYEVNVWEEIARMCRGTLSDADWEKCWELAGMPVPEEYLEAA